MLSRFTFVSIRNNAFRNLKKKPERKGIASGPEESKRWINELFDHQKPCELLTHPERFLEDINSPIQIPGCLIDDPKNKLLIPLVDFDPNILADQLIEMSKEVPSDRAKPVGATVKGSGGGKTRAFEEIRRILLIRKNVLVIGITFNNLWVYESSLDNWSSVAKSLPSLSYALSVISRIASVTFNKGFRETVYSIKKEIDSLPEYYRINPNLLIRHFSSYIVDRVSIYREIDTFILLVDEVLRLEEGLYKKFPDDSKYDVTSVLRTALLDENISNKKIINTTLAISSLSDAPIGVTSSGRFSQPLLLPNRLNSKDIVNDIFQLSHCNDADKLLMENIARTVDTIPRLIQFMRDFIIKQKKNQQNINDNLMIDCSFVKKLFDDCAEKVDLRYETENIIISNKVLSAIVYGDNLELDDEDTLNAISNSVISNTLKTFNRKKTIITNVETSVLMLWRATKSTGVDNKSLPRFIHRGISEIITKISNFQKEGDLLEVLLFEWMKIRIYAAAFYDQQSRFTLGRLLGLDNDLIPNKYLKIFNTPINIFNTRTDIVVDIIGSSYDNIEKQNEEIMNIKVSSFKPIVIVRLLKNKNKGKEEACDLIVIVNNPDSEQPFYIAYDTKGRKEGLSYQNKQKVNISELRGIIPLQISDLPKKGEQYLNFKEMMQFNKRKAIPDFMYIYFRTYNVTSFMIENENDVVIELTRDDSKKFFGPSIFDLYLTLRNSMDKN